MGPCARSRAGPGPARTSYLPGSTSLAWVYKPSVGLQDKPPQRRQAPNIEHSPRKKCYEKGGPAQVPGPGPGPGLAQRARHTCIRLLDLPGSISPAWKEERRKKKEEKGRKQKQQEERRKQKQKEERRKKKTNKEEERLRKNKEKKKQEER